MKSNSQFDGITFQDQLDKDGNLIAIKRTIRLKGVKDPIEVTKYLNEYKQKNGTWQKYPDRMLHHKATIQCARYTFGFSNIYEDRINEINQIIENKLISHEMFEQIKELITQTENNEKSLLSYTNVEKLTDLSCTGNK